LKFLSVIDSWKSFLKKTEPYAFILFCLIGTLPILLTKYYVTLDGPAHLYNANIIKELLFDNYSEIQNVFSINYFPVPNLMSQLIMSLLNLALPSFISEKIFLLLYFVLTPIFFRKYMLLLYPGNRAFTYLILLFLHNNLLYFGFYNMCIAVTFLFITSYYNLKYCKTFSLKHLFILSFLLLLIYFSHIFIFFIAILVQLITICSTIKTKREFDEVLIVNYKIILGRLKLLFVSLIPCLVLSFIYFLKIDSIESNSRPSIEELIKWLIDIKPLLTLCDCSDWWNLTHILLGLFVIIIATNVFLKIKNGIIYRSNHLYFKPFVEGTSYWWLFSSLAFLILYFIMPNAILLSDRLIFVFYLFLIIWLGSLHHPKFIHIITFVVVVVLQITFIRIYVKEMKGLSVDAKKLESIATNIESNHLTLTLNYSNNWLHSHISGYVGANKAIPVIENYEAQLKWFTINWNKSVYELDILDNWGVNNKDLACDFYLNSKDTMCFSLNTKADHRIKPIDYIIVLGKPDTSTNLCNDKVKTVLDNYYIKLDSNDLCMLYKLKITTE